MSAVQVQPRTG